MPTPQELETKFWSHLKSDRTVMLGLADGPSRPMTAQVDGERGDIWFFTSTDTKLVQDTGDGAAARISFSAKGHDLFACVEGDLVLSHDRAVIDRLWNPFVAAWYEGGKDDPKLVLLRFSPVHAEIWLGGSSVIAGIKLLLGIDPKDSYKDNVADVRL